MTGRTLFTTRAGGTIWCPATGDHHAVLVEDGRVAAVDDEALARGATAKVVDANVAEVQAADAGVVDVEVVDAGAVDVEGFLMPAFGDGHAHPLFGGLEADGPQVRPQRSVEAIVAEVGRFADEHPELPWITGASYDSSLAPEGLFDARWLDAAVPDRPVLLRAWDYHTVWANSRALELAGITAQTPDPPLGEITRRDDGSPLGTLREWGAVELVTAVAPAVPVEQMVQAIERAGRSYAAHGVTWVQDAWVEPAQVEAYLVAAQQDRLPVRINLALYADPRRWPDQLDEILEQRRRVDELGHPLLTARTVKFFADGVIENETGAVLQPYCGHEHDGMLVWPRELLARAVTDVDAHGLQPHIHTIGDRAARVALDSIDAAAAANGPRDRRAVLAHVQLVDEADRARFAAHGTVANAEPLWAQLDDLMTVLTSPRLGQERSDTQYPFASLLAAGAPLSFGSDWPVSSAVPLDGIAVACSRQTSARVPAGGWVPDQRLDVETALRAYTDGVAHQGFRHAGVLTPGAEADLVLLDRDPRTVPDARDLDTLSVLGTWVRGIRVHDSHAPTTGTR